MEKYIQRQISNKENPSLGSFDLDAYLGKSDKAIKETGAVAELREVDGLIGRGLDVAEVRRTANEYFIQMQRLRGVIIPRI